ncbi:VacJ family lipoprotein [Novosphingobium sp.]|uniref:MlaA family lipoprotein n=1 Tax=Novosphingobium sp. TaxID=1874826 RepID=UPI0028ADDA1B|nr:VacJ family lipoprotein [Novosphingobium sp.]
MSLPAAAVALLMTGPSMPDAPVHLVDLQVANLQAASRPLQLAEAQAAAPAAGAAIPAPVTTGEIATPSSSDPVQAQPPVADPLAPAPTPPAQAAPDQPESEIVVTAPQPPPPGDPLERINAESFKVVQSVDKAVLEPVAKAYNKGLPRPVRKGLRNFFTNLGEPVVFAAFLLQLKPGKAAETAGRFVINTTLGVGGLMDVAKKKPFNLPYRPNGVANTLGYYGVGPGPYMYLPIIGPTTLRDIIGDSIDKLLLPAAIGKPFTNPEVVIPMTVVRQLGERAAFDERINEIREEDRPYATYRDLYLKQRQAEIDALHGRVTPGVVPVYGPGLKVPGKKDRDKQGEAVQPATGEAEPAPETAPPVTPAPAAPAADETIPASPAPAPAPAPAPVPAH